jgi:hypothetical protein
VPDGAVDEGVDSLMQPTPVTYLGVNAEACVAGGRE